jgi:nucleotide-binding universal stress UspA family protein
VCTDGSSEGQNAVAITLELARACGSQVFVIQVLEIPPQYQMAAPDVRSVLGQEIQKNMATIIDAAARMEVDLKTLVAEGQAIHTAIMEAAAKVQPDLLVLGRCGKTALARLFMGNVAARVIGHSPVNVLVVPRGAAVAFQRLLVASDGSACSQQAWGLALAMARRAQSQLIAVAVAPEEGDIIDAKGLIHQMLQAANRARMPLKGVNPQGVPADEGIVQQAIKSEVDLIIMGSHGRTGLKKILMGSVTERVIGQAPCPVLVVKQGEKPS